MDLALIAAKRAVDKDPAKDYYHTIKAHALLGNHQYEEAMLAFEWAIKVRKSEDKNYINNLDYESSIHFHNNNPIKLKERAEKKKEKLDSYDFQLPDAYKDWMLA